MLDPLRRLISSGTGKVATSAHPRLGLLWKDLADLSARTMTYMLAVLGLLHVLGQIAAGP